MKNLIKFINVIIFSVFIIQGLLFADQNASKDGIVHPGGLGVVNVKSKDGRQRGNVESQWWLNEENLTEYTDVKNWMLDEGLEFNGTNLTDLTLGIHRCVNKMWRDALLGFKSCETLKNHRGGKTYKELFDGIEDKNKQKRILFNPSVSPGAAAQLDASGDNIELPIGDLEGIVRYYAQKMISGDFNIKDFSDPKGDASSKHFFEQTGYLGHEMLHAFTGLSAAVYPGDSKTALAIKTECMVHCLQKCIDPSHRQMVNECNGKDTDTFCEIGDTCEFEECFKKFPPMAYNWGGNISFGNAFNDTPDDNYSHYAGIYSLFGLLSSSVAFPLNPDQEFFSYSYYPDVLVYDKFNYPDLPGLLDNYEGTGNIDDYDHGSFSNNHRLLIIPSGEFMGDENSSIIKEALKQFVETGGTLLVLSQQYDTHIENLVPVPEGENIDFVGWRQDQSCYHGSVYFKGMHPVLSSSTGELLSGAVDGYFEAWPSTSTVLLNRSKNREAAMLYYPYGNGTVILTSLYTDWGYAHSQATLMELRVVRDLITFAKNPQFPIPMYDLTENFYPVIDLNVKVKNSAETPAAKVILKAYTPDRKRVLHQVEQALTLAPGEEVEIPVQFTLPGLGHTEYGICHVDYELYDNENNLVQIPTESDGGRFAVHNMTRPYTPSGGMDMWLTVEDEEVPHYEIPEFTLHIKNYTDIDQTIDFTYECNHRGSHPLFSVTVPANGRIDRPIIIENEEPFQRLWLYPNPGETISKGVNTIWGNTGSTLTLTNPGALEPGGTLNYTVTSNYVSTTPDPGDYPIRLTLEKYGHGTDNYTEVAVVYETTHDFSLNRTFNYTGSFTPSQPLVSGLYRLKLEVKDNKGFPETNRFQSFTYQQSGFSVTIDPVQTGEDCAVCIYPGRTYTIPIKVTNTTDNNQYDVKNGTLILVLESASGQEVYRKEITNITVNSGEEIQLSETFTFTPVDLGTYYLRYRYWDETGEELPDFFLAQRLWYGTNVTVGADKTAYDYLDTAKVAVKIAGVGTYNIHFTCTEAGIDEIRDIQVPEGSTGTTEVFQVPIGLEPYYRTKAVVKDSTGFTHINGKILTANQLVFDYRGNFSETFARAGNDLEFELNITGISGMFKPVTGELSITATGLDFQSTQTATLQPGVENPFTFTIPIAADIAAGTYRLDVSFKIAGVEYINKHHYISLPDAAVEFTAPETAYNAGDTLTFTAKNTGGKNAAYTIEILLKDSKNQIAAQLNQLHNIAAGSANTLYLNIPDSLKTGPYQLAAAATRTFTNERTEAVFPVSITGMSAQLDSYTLKELYFDNEIITGKSDILNGTRDIENGTLDAKIVKLENAPAVESIFGSFTCMTKDNRGWIWIGTTGKIAYYDGTAAHEITQLPDNSPVDWIFAIAASPDNKIYALRSESILEIDGQNPANIVVLPLRYPWDYCSTIGVDDQSRLWAVYDGEMQEISYYDAGSGTWNNMGYGQLKEIISDKNGGIWVSRNYGLLHITASLATSTVTPGNTNMPTGNIQSLYADTNGTLMAVISQTLYRFNGATWTNLSNFAGYPTNGVLAVTGDDSGSTYAVGINADYSNSIYLVENLKLVQNDTAFTSYEENGTRPLAAHNNHIYTYGSYSSSNGGDTGNSIYGLLKINLDGGGEQVAWTGNFPVDITAGNSLTVNLDTGMTLDPGVYILKTTLTSVFHQELAQSAKTFTVRDSDVAVSLSPDSSFSGVVRSAHDLPLTVDVLNNTTETKTGLQLTVTKISPSGTTETFLSETLDLDPGQTEQRSLTFNETALGAWRLEALLTDAEGTRLSGQQLAVQVAEPDVSMTVTASTYAGDDPFHVKIKLANQGEIKVSLDLQASVTNGGDVKLEEPLTLTPGEERLLTFNDTLTADSGYEITISGDVSDSQTVTVLYGYKENFSINVLPSYREGTVSIGYDVSNSGGLPFTGTYQFELSTLGSSAPLYTLQRTHNLYPGAGPVTDYLRFPLSPGNYRLTYTTGKNPTPQTALFTVTPNGTGTVSYTAQPYPTGPNQIPYTLTNIDTAAGLIPLTITITGPDNSTLLTDTRNHYLEPGETAEDFILCDFPQKGNYTLSITGSKLSAPLTAVLRVLDNRDITASLAVGAPETGTIPITLDMTNNGFYPFGGTLTVDVSGIRSQFPVTVPPASSLTDVFPFQTAALTPGTKEVNAVLTDTSGNIVAQTTGNAAITGADIKITGVPENLEIDAGGFAEAVLTLENQGHLRGDAILKVSAFDSLYQEREIALEPGKQIDIDGLFIDVPADLPTGNYPFDYSLTGSSVAGGKVTGRFTFKVNGVSLEVDAALDRSLYSEGETAQLTLDISSSTAAGVPLEAVVNWGNFSERRAFTLTPGSASLLFDIPLDEKRMEKVFYGIYFEGGKGIHLNDIYLHFSDIVSVETDRQVYAPDDVINVVFSSDESGTLTAETFGESHTLTLSSSVSATFAVPADTPGGTYGISWQFTPADTTQEQRSGSHPFDVSGLVVKVAKAQLEKGKYTPGETVNADYVFESNRGDTLDLRCWTVAPSGSWEYLGESSIAVSVSSLTNALSSYSFNTTEAGTHELVYGLYKVSDEDKLIVSGRLAFDVGDAVLLGIAADRFDYKEGNETVNLLADYFGNGSAQLEVYLDDEKVTERSITIDGTGQTTVSLAGSGIGGGSHTLRAVLSKDGLTSTKTTGFLYGTNLPDLTVRLKDAFSEGLNYTYTVEVTNAGKSASPSAVLAIADNGDAVQTVSIPSLLPGGSHEITFNWSGSGKAGAHEFLFDADSTGAVKEYSESNNRLTIALDVPALFYTLEVDPLTWPANSEMVIVTRLIDNGGTVTALTLDLSITNDSSNEVIFQRTRVEELPAFGTKTLSDNFNTGVFPAGSYTLRQTVGGGSVDRVESVTVTIDTTKALEAALSIQPQSVPAGTDAEMELSMAFTNTGNVSLEDEPLLIEIFNKDTSETVKTEDAVISVPPGGQVTEVKTLALNLVEGNYEIRLKHMDALIGVVEFSAAGGLERDKFVSVRPRVLIMTAASQVQHMNELAFLTGLFQAMETGYETGNGVEDSFVRLHRGYSNITVLFGAPMGRNECDELRERVWSGEGLILVQDNSLNNPGWVEFLGVSIANLSAKEREAAIILTASDLGLAGGFQLKDKGKCALIVERDDVTVIGETAGKKHPVAAFRKYGSGYVLVFSVPLDIQSGMEDVSQLLMNAVTMFSRDVYSVSDITRLLPLGFSLTNETQEERELTVMELLPYGVMGYDYVPEPVEGDELKWNLDVSGGGTAGIYYWLQLPDQINVFDIVSEIYEGDVKRDEVSLSFEVSQTVLSRIDELVVDIGALEAVGEDLKNINKAKEHLLSVRSRVGETLTEVVLNLEDALRACDYIGKVTNIDVSELHLKVVSILRVMARRHYEKITN